MKKLLILFAFVFISNTATAATYVSGYQRKDGTYVQPYYRTKADGSKFNNFSTRGNYNPYTGKMGTVSPYPSNSFPSTNGYPSANSYPKQGNGGYFDLLK